MGSARAFQGRTDEWLTPPELVAAVGPFDLDPASPVNRPWPTATKHYTIHDDGLAQPWAGRVWLNPPYGPSTGRWLQRLAEHTDGIALVFARTETVAFHRWVWPRATAVLFLRGRLHFCTAAGVRARLNCGGPSVLVAYGQDNADRLHASGVDGQYVALRP